MLISILLTHQEQGISSHTPGALHALELLCAQVPPVQNLGQETESTLDDVEMERCHQHVLLPCSVPSSAPRLSQQLGLWQAAEICGLKATNRMSCPQHAQEYCTCFWALPPTLSRWPEASRSQANGTASSINAQRCYFTKGKV